MKNFVKALDKTNSEGFQYFKIKFLKISTTKLKKDMRPQISELIKDNDFVHHFNIPEQAAWKAFIWKITKLIHIRMKFKI